MTVLHTVPVEASVMPMTTIANRSETYVKPLSRYAGEYLMNEVIISSL